MTLPPQRVPLIDGKLITREWLIALRGLDPVSQTESIAALQESITALQSALDELAAEVALEDASADVDKFHLQRQHMPYSEGFNPVQIQSSMPRQVNQPADTQALLAARIFGV
jgi:hypothetical protein